jgi:hypothetical protein
MRAQEYKTVFVTDLGSFQQAVAITKMTDRERRRRRYRKMRRRIRRRKLRPLFFTAKPRGSNPAQQMTFKR